jgi:S1-C subfamily serine protease
MKSPWRGSGTVVEFFGDFYIATAQHVLENLTAEYMVRIVFADGSELDYNASRNGFYKHPRADVALIPFSLPRGRTGARVRDRYLRVGKRLIGISLHGGSMNGLDCHVKALDMGPPWNRVKLNDSVMTDCGGVPGFSGTGYFDTKGRLIAVHQGGQTYPHGPEGVIQEGRVDELFKGLNVSCRVNLSDGSVSQQCYDDLQTVITLSSRNPSASAVPVKYLVEIADGIRRRTVTLFRP